MLEIIEEVKRFGERIEFFEITATRQEDRHLNVWVKQLTTVESCAICGASCPDGWLHPESSTVICADCPDFWDHEAIVMTPAELDEMCDAADDGDEDGAQAVVARARSRSLGCYVN